MEYFLQFANGRCHREIAGYVWIPWGSIMIPLYKDLNSDYPIIPSRWMIIMIIMIIIIIIIIIIIMDFVSWICIMDLVIMMNIYICMYIYIYMYLYIMMDNII